MPLQVLTRDSNGITFSDPDHPQYTFRTKTSKTKKSLNGQNVDNYVTEIIINDTSPIALPGGTNVGDALSIRLRLSGSGYSEARVNSLLKNLAGYIPKFVTSHSFLGFEPAAPDYPVV